MGKNIRLFYINQWDIHPAYFSSQLVNFPGLNTQTRSITNMWYTQGKTGEYAKINGTNIPLSGFFAFGHNLTAGATAKLQASNTDKFAAPDWEVDLLQSTEHIDKPGRIKRLAYAGDPETPLIYNDWRLYIDDPANTEESLKIGRLWAGICWEPEIGFSKKSTPDILDESIINLSSGRQATTIQKARYYTWNLHFPCITQREEYEKLIWSRGNALPLVMLIKPFGKTNYIDAANWSYYVRIARAKPDEAIQGDKWPLQMDIIEES